MNNIYKVLIGIFVGICACFLMFDEVKAIPTNAKTKNGFAMCTYKSKSKQYNRDWILYGWAYYDMKGNPHTGLSLTYINDGSSKEVVADFVDYNKKYKNNEDMIKKFRKNNLWNCPTYIYLQEARDGGILGIGSKSSFEVEKPYVKDVVFGKSDAELGITSTTGQIDLDPVSWGKVTSQLDGAILNPTSTVDAPAGSGSTADSNGNSMSTEQVKDHNDKVESHNDEGLPNTEAIKNYWNNKSGANYGNEQGDCSLIDSSMQSLLNTIFTWVSIIGIILVVALSILDGIKAIVGTEEGFRNFLKGLKTRIICLIVLLLAPVIVTFAIQTINGVANIAGVNSDDPLCGVGE